MIKPFLAFCSQTTALYVHGSGNFKILIQSVFSNERFTRGLYVTIESVTATGAEKHTAPTHSILCSRLHLMTTLWWVQRRCHRDIYKIHICFSFWAPLAKSNKSLIPKILDHAIYRDLKAALKRRKTPYDHALYCFKQIFTTSKMPPKCNKYRRCWEEIEK